MIATKVRQTKESSITKLLSRAVYLRLLCQMATVTDWLTQRSRKYTALLLAR